MRVAAWALVVCAALGAISVFLPSLELRAGAVAISKRTKASIYGVSRDRDKVARLLAAYRRAPARGVGSKLLRHVAPRVGGRPGSVLADARDAIDTLDGVADDDIRTAGRVLSGALWGLIGLEVMAAGLVFSALLRGVFTRRRFVGALLAAALGAVIAVGLHVACQVAAWEANDEVGVTVMAVTPGAYVLPLAALGALGLAIALVARPPLTEPGRA